MWRRLNAADWTDQRRWNVDATFAVWSRKFHLWCHILGSISTKWEQLPWHKKLKTKNWFTDLVTESHRKSCMPKSEILLKNKIFPPCSCQSVTFMTVSGCKIWNKAHVMVCGWVLPAVRSSAPFLQMFPGSCGPAHTRLYPEAVRCFLWIPSAEPRLSGGSWAARRTQTPPSDPGTCTHTQAHGFLGSLSYIYYDTHQILIILTFHCRIGCLW